MSFSNSTNIPLDSIIVERDDRQRREIEVEDLKASISRRGLINPLIVTKEFKLVAGERRLTALRELGFTEVPVRFIESLSPIEHQLIELEENLKRRDLDWKDECLAVLRIHQLYCSMDPEWTLGETANELSLTSGNVSLKIQVANELAQGNERIAAADGSRQAYNLIARRESREAAKELEELLSVSARATAAGASGAASGAASAGASATIAALSADGKVTPLVPLAPLAKDIICQSFLDWAPQYEGPKFNLIHCDFPYGIDYFSGPQARGGTDLMYEDSKDVYFELLDCLCTHLDNFTSLSAHFVFWFSMKHYEPTKAMLRNKAPSIEWLPHPLIWGKSDNSGIVGDHRRHPRHIYECALFGIRGKRQVIKSKGDFYAAPTDRQYHTSAKPVPMLKHFFEMLVDEHTSILDPTCGAGSALRAADALGAERVLGLEIDKQHAETAQTLLNTDRALRSASKSAAVAGDRVAGGSAAGSITTSKEN